MKAKNEVKRLPNMQLHDQIFQAEIHRDRGLSSAISEC